MLAVVDVAELQGVITDRTPFHPVDHTWPDQPADTGTLDGEPVVATLLGAVAADGSVTVGSEIPARRGDDGYDWVVVRPRGRAERRRWATSSTCKWMHTGGRP